MDTLLIVTESVVIAYALSDFVYRMFFLYSKYPKYQGRKLSSTPVWGSSTVINMPLWSMGLYWKNCLDDEQTWKKNVASQGIADILLFILLSFLLIQHLL